MIEVTTNGWLVSTFDTPKQVGEYVASLLTAFDEPIRIEIKREAIE